MSSDAYTVFGVSRLPCFAINASRACVVKNQQNKLFLQHCIPRKRYSMRRQSLWLFNYGVTRLFYNAKGNKVVQLLQNSVFLQRLVAVKALKTWSYSIMLHRYRIRGKNNNVYSRPDFKHLFISYIYYDSMNSPHSSYIFLI